MEICMKNFDDIKKLSESASKRTHRGIKHASGHLPHHSYHVVKVENGWELRDQDDNFVSFTDHDPKIFRKGGYGV